MPSPKDYQQQEKAKEEKLQAGIQNAAASVKEKVIDTKIAIQQKAESVGKILQKGADKTK